LLLLPQPWLELFAVPIAKSTGRVQNRVLADCPQQHVSEVSVTCAAPTGNFYVAVDGMAFGPFHTIRIAAMHSAGSRRRSTMQPGVRPLPTKFPVQTFARLTNL
jgi:hypothetical protein